MEILSRLVQHNIMKKAFLLLAILFTTVSVYSQVSITTLSVPYTQDFNSLVDTGLNNPYTGLPIGWFAEEYGTGANTNYRAAWGQLAGGDLYSFGDSAVAERALGSIGSGTVAPVQFGIAIINNTGSIVNKVRISYRGELWRVGNPARSTGPDTLHFSYGKNNGDLHSNTWTDFSGLSFISPASSTGLSNIELDGNASAQVVNLNDSIINLSLAVGDTLWLRWHDDNSSSFDDGLGIDDISITFFQASVSYGLPDIATFNTYYNQDFNSISNVYSPNASFSTLPFGWFAKEYGANADNTYKTAYGEFAGGNIYSFGDSLSTERALGSIGSGALNMSHYGAAFINTTGSVIDNIEINYMGEMWRQGRNGRASGPDTLHFSYATHATGIDTGNYIDYSPLNFYAPVTTGTLNTPMNGNNAANRTYVTGILSGLNLQQGDTVWVRWTDYDSDSYDDGLAIDSFSLAAVSTPALLNIEFQDAVINVNENDRIISVPVVVHHKSSFLSMVEVYVENSGTIDMNTDIALVSSYIPFPGNTNDSIAYFDFSVSNSQPFEADEYFVLGLRNPVNGFLGAQKFDTIYLANYQYPTVPISVLTTDDANGISDSINNSYTIQGVVHGINYSLTGGVDFYVIENGKGINVYQPSTSSYVPSSGDKVKIWGKIGQFRGLTRIEAPDSIQLVSSGNALETPIHVNNVAENNEASYLEIDSLKLIPAISIWPNNLEVLAVHAQTLDTVSIYISTNSDLAGTSAPADYFSIIGIGSQFNNGTNAPFVNGYRLMAVSKSLTVPTAIETVAGNKGIKIYPNPFTDEILIGNSVDLLDVSVYTIDGKLMFQSSPANPSVTIHTETWNKGVYVIRTTDAAGVKINKIVKK